MALLILTTKRRHPRSAGDPIGAGMYHPGRAPELDAAAQARLRQSGYSVEQILEDWFPPEPAQSSDGR